MSKGEEKSLDLPKKKRGRPSKVGTESFDGNKKLSDVRHLEIPGYHVRVVNEDRVGDYMSNLGYSLVTKEEFVKHGGLLFDDLVPGNENVSNYVSKIVDSNMKAYYMKQPLSLREKFAEEDKRRMDSTDEAHGRLNTDGLHTGDRRFGHMSLSYDMMKFTKP